MLPVRSMRAEAGVPRARRLVSGCVSVVVVALFAGLVYLFWPSSLGGCSTVTIVSGQSMEPTYSTGDLVWSRCGQASVGDIVVYEAQDVGGAHVIHRIIGGNGVDGWVLQGDNNDFIDPWSPDDSRIVGIATVHIPHLGAIVYSLASPFVWGSLLILASAILLWPSNQDPAAAAEVASTDPAASVAPEAASPSVDVEPRT